MILAKKSICFFRDHADRVIGYSKEAAKRSFYLILYSISTLVAALVSIIYISEPPTELLKIVVDLFLSSPFVVIAAILFSMILLKIEITRWLSYADPHPNHPIADFLLGILIMVAGAYGIEYVNKNIVSSFTGGVFSEGLVVFAELVIFIGFYSVLGFLAAITANGFCRSVYQFLSGILFIRRFTEIPSLLMMWYRKHLTRLRRIVDAYKIITLYAKENDTTTFSATIEVFTSGLKQIEPIGPRSKDEIIERNSKISEGD